MKKLYPMIALLMISTALTAQTRRLIKATTSGNWNSAATWTTVGVPTTPGDNDSVVIAPGVTVTVVGNGNSFTLVNSVLDIFGTLIFNEASNANKTNELNFSTTTSNIAVPVIRLGNASSSIAKGLTGNGSGQISVIVNGQSALLSFDDLFRYVGIAFLVSLPLILLLGKGASKQAAAAAH